MSKGKRVREQHQAERNAAQMSGAKTGKKGQADPYKKGPGHAIKGGNAAAIRKPKKNIPWFKIILSVIVVIVIALGGFLIYRHLNKGVFDTSSYVYMSYDKYIKLGDYKKLEYTVKSEKVTDKEVQEQVQSKLDSAKTEKTITSGTVKKGDKINIDYVGKIDGKTFTGGSASGTTITLGSAGYIDGFESGLMGKKIGSKVNLHLQFPKDYRDSKVAGKKVVFAVTINSKIEETKPSYDADFITEDSDGKYDNKVDYEANIRKTLQRQKDHQAEDTAKSTLISTAVSNAKVVSYPKGKVSAETDKLIEQYKSMASQYGMEWKDYLSATGSTEKELRKTLKSSAQNQVKENLVINAIIKKEKVDTSDSAYKSYLKELLKDADMTEDSFKKAYNMSIEEYAEQNNMENGFLSDQVGETLMKLGTKK